MTLTDGPTFDLQSHSLHSDGALAPADVVGAAAAAGVRLLALTDHDTTAGVAEAARAAQSIGIGLVPGVEISTRLYSRQDLHILGYAIAPDDGPLTTALTRSRGDRETRAARMVTALHALGFSVDEDLLGRRTAAGLIVGRPHVAEAVVGHPANRERLTAEGLTDPSEFLAAYLIEDRPAFVARDAPSVTEAIELIHGAGGVAVWAHPFWDIDASAEVLEALEAFHAQGLDGVEAFYVTHTEPQARLLAQRAEALGMLTTGSADFHGPEHQTFSAFRAFSTYGLAPRLGPLAAFAADEAARS